MGWLSWLTDDGSKNCKLAIYYRESDFMVYFCEVSSEELLAFSFGLVD
jgi:hypothetical protein